MNIADVFFRALLDEKELEPSAAAAGDKAGQTLGEHMSSRAGAAIKTGTALLVGTAIGLATAGAVGLAKLDEVTRRYAADTGATVDETRSAQSAINDLFRKNTNSYEEIGGVLATLRTSLHLTEAQTESSAQMFLTFAKAVGGPPVETTKALTGVLKAYNLTVDQAPGLMDKLVVAHQRYGTAVLDNVAVLTQLAPALTAANLSIDDGIGLLDLFAKAGVDAAAAPAALTKALHKIKSPEELQQLIKQIAQEPDDFKQAAEAAVLFGAKAGPKLAAVLKGTNGELAQFSISATDAADATAKAADVIDAGFGEQIVLALHNAQGAVTGFFGFLASIDPTGFLTQALAPRIGKGLARAFEVAAGLAIVEQAVAFAADRHATLYLKTLILGDSIGGALSKAWGAASGRVLAAATALGASSFAAVAAPFLIPIIATVVIATILPTSGNYAEVKAEAEQKLGEQLSKIDTSTWGVATGKKTGERAGDAMVRAWRDAVLDRAKSELPAAITLATRGAFGSDLAARSDYARAYARRMGNLMAAAVAQGVKDKRSLVDTAWTDLIDGLKNRLGRSQEFARDIGRLLSKNLRDGMKSADPEVKAQAEYTKQLILDRLQELATGGTKIGKSSMTLLQQAIRSKDKDISAAARAIVYSIDHPLSKVPASAYTYGAATAQGFADGITSKAHAAAVAASHLAGAVGLYLKPGSPTKLGPLSTLGGAEGWGERIAAYFTRGLERHLPNLSASLGSGLQLPTLAGALPAMGHRSPSFAGIGGMVMPAGAGSVTNNYNVAVEGIISAKDDLSVAREMRRVAEFKPSIDRTRPLATPAGTNR